MRRKITLPSRLLALYLVLTLLVPPLPAFAGSTVVAPGSGNTRVYAAPNGVQVIDINSVNGAGLSINRFTDYNVAKNGQVLNNTDHSQISNKSQLAGQVAANLNLTDLARVILLEVVSPNRTLMEGFTEVLGGKAAVVVANPYGITCAGCGFINTDRVSLVTGAANINPNGGLGAFSVGGGDILVTGSGLNASAQQLLDLVSRSIRIDGQVNAQDLSLVAGANFWDYDSRRVTGPAAASGPAPAYAIDSTVFGGMFARRISLLATEAGVGVRMLGDAAATAQDFTLNSAGKIVLSNKVQSAGNLSVTTAAPDADALTLTDATLATQGNLNLTAAGGGAILSGGALAAGGDLAGSFKTLSDSASTTNLTDNNKRFAAGALKLTTSGTAAIDGVSFASGGALSGDFGSLASGVNAGATFAAGSTLGLWATAGDLALGSSVASAPGDLTLAAAGKITLGAGTVQTTSGNLSLTAANGLDNAGVMTADNGSVTARVSGTLSGGGTLNAGSALDIKDLNGGASENLTLGENGVLLGNTVDIAAAAVTLGKNSGIGSTGDLTLRAGALTLSDATAEILAAPAGGGSAVITVDGNLDNHGGIRSGGDLALTAAGAVNGAGGTISAKNGLVLKASGGMRNDGSIGTDTGDLTARVNGTLSGGGTMNAAGALNIRDLSAEGSENIALGENGTLLGKTVDIAASAVTLSKKSGIGSGTQLNLRAASLALSDASAKIAAATSGSGAAIIGVAGALDNQGAIRSGTTLDLSAGGISNGVDGGISAKHAVLISSTGDLKNDGIISSDSSTVSAKLNGTLSGSGAINAAGALDVSDLDGNGTENITLDNGGVLLGSSVDIKAKDVSLGKNSGIGSGSDLNLQAKSLSLGDATAKIIAASPNSNLTLNAADSLTNEGEIYSGGSLTASAATLTNGGSGSLSAHQAVKLSAAGNLRNDGMVSNVTGDITLKSGGTLSGGGTVNSAGALAVSDLNGAGSENINLDAGGVLIGDSVAINAAAVTLGKGSGIVSGTSLTLQAKSLSLNDATALIVAPSSGSSAIISVSDALANQGTIASGGDLTVTAGSISNSASGAMSAASSLKLSAAGNIANNGLISTDTGDIAVKSNGTLSGGGAISAAGTLTISDLNGGNNANITLNENGILLGEKVDISASAVSLGKNAGIGSRGDLNIAAKTLSLNDASSQIVAATKSTWINPGSASIVVSGALSNAGGIRSEGAMELAASSIVNSASGALSAAGNLAVYAGNGLTNDGTISADSGDITARVSGTLAGKGTVAASGVLDIKDASGGSSENIELGENGVLFGNSVSIAARSLTLGAGSSLSSNFDMAIDAAKGVSVGSKAKIVAAPIGIGNARITVSDGNIDNHGIIYSGAGLDLSAATITNYSDGSLSSENYPMTLKAVNGLVNDGTIVAVYGDITARVDGTLSGSGVMSAEGALNVRDSSGGNTENVQLGIGGALVGKKVDISASAVSLGKDSGIGSNGDLTLQAKSLGLASGATILGDTGTAAITVDGILDNEGGAIRSGYALTVTAAGITNAAGGSLTARSYVRLDSAGGLSNNGTIGADVGNITVRTNGISGTGVISAGNYLDIADANGGGSESITLGGGGVLLGENVDISAAALTLGIDSGIGSKSGYVTLALSGKLTNQGTISAGNNLSITADEIANTRTGNSYGALSSESSMELNASGTKGLSNDGSIISQTGAILARVNGGYSGTGAMSAAVLLDVASFNGGSSENITVGEGGVLLGGRVNLAGQTVSLGAGSGIGSTGELNLQANSLDIASTGKIIAATSESGAATINTTTALSNAGTVRSGDTLAISAPSISNAGTGVLSSRNTMTLSATGIAATGNIANAGKIVTDSGGVQVRARGTLSGTGSITAGGLLDIKHLDGQSMIGSVAVGDGGKLFGAAVDINAAAVSVGKGASIVSDGNLDLYANTTLTLADLNSKIIAGHFDANGDGVGDAKLTTFGYLRNPGVIHSYGNLSLSAFDITNYDGAAISALDTLKLDSAVSLSNSGTLYAGKNLVATAKGNFTNTATLAKTQGQIISDGDMTLTARIFVNNSVINAANNITISAPNFTNSVVGGDTRSWFEISRGGEQVDHIDTWYWIGGSCPGYDRCERYWLNQTVTQAQKFQNGIAPGFKPEIIGGLGNGKVTGNGTVTVQGFDTASNVGSILSGQNLVLTGNVANPNATFTNTDLTLNKFTWVDSYTRFVQSTGNTIWGFDVQTSNDSGHMSAPSPALQVVTPFGTDYSAVVEGKTSLSGGRFVLNNIGSTGSKDVAPAPTVAAIGGDSAPTGGALAAAPGVTAVADAGIVSVKAVRGASATTATADSGGSAPGPVTITGPAGTAVKSINAATAGSAGPIKAGAAPAVASISATATPVPAGFSFNGVKVNLPTSPNGYYVLSKDPNSNYLIEVNPLYANPNALGSSYLEQKLGIQPDKLVKQLGDASYEDYLVRQQLINLANTNLLKGYANETAQIKGFMDQAADQSATLGLKFGTALTSAQQAALKGDIVWMVETTVNGQKVLEPMVYLSAATLAGVESGAVITAGSMDLNLTSLTNTGGTISADSMKITSSGDIRNSSGTIKGGDLSLNSTGGSITNETLLANQGNSVLAFTTIGKQAGITATNNLNLGAAEDIINKGARMAAGGDANLKAGGNVVFDTIENKTVTSNWSTSSSTTVRTTDQIKSQLEAGGALSIKSKNDITLAGTDVTAGKSASLDAAGDVNILARNNTRDTDTKTSSEGWGVGGGLYGKQSTDTDHYTSTNVGSTITVGKGDTGALNIKAGKTVTVKGSELAAGEMGIAATDVKILAGENVDKTTTKTETTSYLSISNGSDATKSSSSDASSTGAKGGTTANSAANASASADYTKDAGGLDFVKTNKTDTVDETKTSVGSKLKAKGNISITTTNDITLQGASVKAGGDVNLDGNDVNILAAQNTHTNTSSSDTTKVGLYAKSSNSADAKAGTKAGATIGTAGVSADADATAKSSNSIDFVRTNKTDTTSGQTTNTGSDISGGGDLNITSKNKLKVVGSDLSGENAVNLKAKDMSFEAAADTSYSTTKTTNTSVGLYVDATAKADAGAKAGASAGVGVQAGASASANASADLSIGVQVDTKTKNETSGSSTARVSSIKSGSGSITRNATDGITDVGTSIDAAGDFSQSAKTITSKAASNTSYSTSTTADTNVKVGVYAKADAGVSADASAKAGIGGVSAKPGVDAKAEVGGGVRVSVNNSNSSDSSNSSDAVVSNIKAGGKIQSVSTEKTSLEGTSITSGGGTMIKADSLEFTAAKNTTSSTSSSNSTSATVSAGITYGAGSKGADASADVGVGTKSANSASSTAVTGSINSGGNLVIQTGKGASFEGTNISSGGSAEIKTGGNLTFAAAKNTASSNSSSLDVGVSVSLDKPKGKASADSEAGLGATVGTNSSKSSSSDAVVGNITSTGKMSISSGKDATFEGTNISAGGDATIAAKGNVNMKAARSTSRSDSTGVSVGLSGKTSTDKDSDGTTKTKSGEGQVGVNTSKADSSTATTGNLASGGSVKITSGKDSTFEGTSISAENKVTIKADGAVHNIAAENSDSSSGFGISVAGSAEKSTKAPTPGKKADPTAPGKADPSDKADPNKKADPGKAPATPEKKAETAAPGKKGEAAPAKKADPAVTATPAPGKPDATPEKKAETAAPGKKGEVAPDKKADPAVTATPAPGKPAATPEKKAETAAPGKKGDAAPDKKTDPAVTATTAPGKGPVTPVKKAETAVSGKKGDAAPDKKADPAVTATTAPGKGPVTPVKKAETAAPDKKGDAAPDKKADPAVTTTTAPGKGPVTPVKKAETAVSGKKGDAAPDKKADPAGTATTDSAKKSATTEKTDDSSKKSGPGKSTAPATLPVVPAVLEPESTDTVTKTSAGGNVGVQVSNSNSKTYSAGKISAGTGGIDISAAGGDVDFQSTKLSSKGDTKVNASGKVNTTTVTDQTTGYDVGITLSGSAASKRTTPGATGTKAGSDPTVGKPSDPAAPADKAGTPTASVPVKTTAPGKNSAPPKVKQSDPAAPADKAATPTTSAPVKTTAPAKNSAPPKVKPSASTAKTGKPSTSKNKNSANKKKTNPTKKPKAEATTKKTDASPTTPTPTVKKPEANNSGGTPPAAEVGTKKRIAIKDTGVVLTEVPQVAPAPDGAAKVYTPPYSKAVEGSVESVGKIDMQSGVKPVVKEVK